MLQLQVERIYTISFKYIFNGMGPAQGGTNVQNFKIQILLYNPSVVSHNVRRMCMGHNPVHGFSLFNNMHLNDKFNTLYNLITGETRHLCDLKS